MLATRLLTDTVTCSLDIKTRTQLPALFSLRLQLIHYSYTEYFRLLRIHFILASYFEHDNFYSMIRRLTHILNTIFTTLSITETARLKIHRGRADNLKPRVLHRSDLLTINHLDRIQQRTLSLRCRNAKASASNVAERDTHEQ